MRHQNSHGCRSSLQISPSQNSAPRFSWLRSGRWWTGSVVQVLAAAIALSGAGAAHAELLPPEAAPPELLEMLSEIDTAASAENLEGVMEHFSPSFTHEDGLTYETLESALTALWERYDSLTYQTRLTGWQSEDDGYVIETSTQIAGTESVGSRSARLDAVIESRQRIENNQIIEQEILSEENRLTLGTTPPSVMVNLPQRVAVGQQFSFDAIVEEPLGDRILLGSAIEEPVTVEGYTTSPEINLDLLSAGGMFKIGRAPTTLGDRWISAVLIRDDGITLLTRRLQVVSPDDAPEELRGE